MSSWPFSGARWWKFDFHTHTPASHDFLQGCDQQDKDQVTPKLWLKKFMVREIDCVAITDHNSGGWIDKLKDALVNLEQEKPNWYRPLHLFPGVEISASGGVHVLAILGIDKGTADIQSLIGAVGYRGTSGGSDTETTKSLGEVIDIICQHDGIPIPAHVDGDKGLFKLRGNTLAEVLKKDNLLAMEVVNSESPRPTQFSGMGVRWSEVRGSDTHNFREKNLGVFTWVKMNSKPSIEGLELALLDGDGAISLDINSNPNRYPELAIEELRVETARYLGRANPLRCLFSPFLNTIIGGRGSGKSTLLEFMRLVLRRDKDIEESFPEIMKDLKKYFGTGDNDLLTADSRLSLIYRKHEVRYRLSWTAKGDTFSLEEHTGGKWQPCTEGAIKSLFPVDIYSQKQIFALANDPNSKGLLAKIDESPAVDADNISKQIMDLASRYGQIDLKMRELRNKIASKEEISGELASLQRQIEQIEKSGHKDILQKYRLRQQQLSEIKQLENKWQDVDKQLDEMISNIALPGFADKSFADQSDMLSALTEENDAWLSICQELQAIKERANKLLHGWSDRKNAAGWMSSLREDMGKYEELREQLTSKGIDPNRYPALLQRRSVLQQELHKIAGYKSELDNLKQDNQARLDSIESVRKQLTTNRQKFLDDVLKGNESLQIEVIPFGEHWEGIEKDIRRILRCSDRFDGDVNNFKNIYQKNSGKNFTKLKSTVENMRSKQVSAKDRRFAKHLLDLPKESINNLLLWWPEDSLKITFGKEKHKLEQGSPGQKAAALLSFILSYGDRPLLLDQPEDDLDNEVIYSSIVKQLRQKKTQKQLIIVTHNANIVVNGDAEMVFPLKVHGGESSAKHADGIQNKEVRQAICDVLEGGKQAFSQRYKRIHLEE